MDLTKIELHLEELGKRKEMRHASLGLEEVWKSHPLTSHLGVVDYEDHSSLANTVSVNSQARPKYFDCDGIQSESVGDHDQSFPTAPNVPLELMKYRVS